MVRAAGCPFWSSAASDPPLLASHWIVSSSSGFWYLRRGAVVTINFLWFIICLLHHLLGSSSSYSLCKLDFGWAQFWHELCEMIDESTESSDGPYFFCTWRFCTAFIFSGSGLRPALVTRCPTSGKSVCLSFRFCLLSFHSWLQPHYGLMLSFVSQCLETQTKHSLSYWK